MATKELTQLFAEFDRDDTDLRRRRTDSGLHRLVAVTTGTPVNEDDLAADAEIIDLVAPKNAQPLHTPIAAVEAVATAPRYEDSTERPRQRAADRFDAPATREPAAVPAEPIAQPRPSASRAAEVIRQIQARAAQTGMVEAKPITARASESRTSARTTEERSAQGRSAAAHVVDMRANAELATPQSPPSSIAAAGPINAGGRTERYRAIDLDAERPARPVARPGAATANRSLRTPAPTKSNVSVGDAMRSVDHAPPASDLELPAWPDNFDDLPGLERNTPIAGHIAVDDGSGFEFVADGVAESLDEAFGEIAMRATPGTITHDADTKRNEPVRASAPEDTGPRATARRAQTLRMHTVPDDVRTFARAESITREAEAISGEYAQAYEDELENLERIDEVGSMVDPVFADLVEPELRRSRALAETPVSGVRTVVTDVDIDDSSAETSEMVRIDERSYERHSAINVDEVSAPRRRASDALHALNTTAEVVVAPEAFAAEELQQGVSPLATMLALIIGPAVAAVVSFSLAAVPLFAWLGGTVGLFVSLFAAGLAIRGRWDGAFINERGHVSASRLQLVVWTAILFPPLLVAVSWNALVAGNAAALEISIPPTLWGLFAMAVASAVAAPMIRNDMDRRGVPLHRAVDNRAARWSDVFRRELTSVRDVISVGKLQLLYVTGVVAAAYGTALYPTIAALDASNQPLAAFPAPSIGVLVLLILSHAAYLGDKVTDDAPARSSASTVNG